MSNNETANDDNQFTFRSWRITIRINALIPSRPIIHQCMKELDKNYKDKVILPVQCPMQSNEYNCGVHVLTNALYHMIGIEAPLAHDYAL